MVLFFVTIVTPKSFVFMLYVDQIIKMVSQRPVRQQRLNSLRNCQLGEFATKIVSRPQSNLVKIG